MFARSGLCAFVLLGACAGTHTVAHVASPAAALPESPALEGDWDLRWDRGFAGWQPAIFQGRLHVEHAGTGWDARLRFFTSKTTFAFRDAQVVDGELHARFTAAGEDVELRGWLRHDKLFGELRWGKTVDWTPVAGRRLASAKLVDRAARRADELDAKALGAFMDKAADEASDAVVVMRDGRVLVEAYAPGYDGAPIMAMSASKSIVSMAIGLLIEDGRLKLDTRLSTLFPALAKKPQGAITVQQLLSHTSGLDPSRASFAAESILKHALDSRLVAPPGTLFQYNNNAVDLLAAIGGLVGAVPFDAYVQQRIFDKLGIAGATWLKDVDGAPRGAGELSIRATDLAKVGQLMLDEGRWRGEQILPVDWIRRSIGAGQPLSADCGLLWWREGRFDYVLHRSILDAWASLGVSATAIDAAKPLLGKSFPTSEAYRDALRVALGASYSSLTTVLDGGNHVPFVYRADGSANGFAARGWLGQYLVVFPATKVVAVRMRRKLPSDSERGDESNGWHGFADDVARLVHAKEERP